MNFRQLVCSPVIGALAALNVYSADTSAATTVAAMTTNSIPYASAVLPGKGLAQHPFLFTRKWDNPDLGPASSIQLLDEPGAAENGELQR